MSDLKYAHRMLDAFASVGADRFLLTFTDMDGQVQSYRPAQRLQDLKAHLPGLMRTAEHRRWSLIVRPRTPEHAHVLLVQLDDVSPLTLERLRDVAFMTVRTSPGSNQAWIAVDHSGDVTNMIDTERRLKRAVDCDKHASGAVRLAGTRNFKPQYGPDYPTVTVLSTAAGRTVTQEQLQGMGLLADIPKSKEIYANPMQRPPSWASRVDKQWPDYAHFQQMNGDDRSRADYFWCMTSSRRGFSVDEIAAQLMQLSPKAREKQHGMKYARQTAERAATGIGKSR